MVDRVLPEIRVPGKSLEHSLTAWVRPKDAFLLQDGYLTLVGSSETVQ
jgi:hypothetical protein